MSPEAFDALAARCERWNERSPRLYRSSVIAIALLGYAYLALLLVASLVVLTLAGVGFYFAPRAAKLWLIMIFSAAVMLWQIMRALWVRFPQPQGIPVTREQAPRLHDAVEELRLSLGAPAVHRILVDGQVNACMAQVPRLGVLPWSRNVLVLGMPLLRSLTVDQARSVVAHELGHLAGAHGRIGAWIYRVRATWGSIAVRLQGHAWVISRFLRWYVPFVNAYSFTLARTQEYQADAAAARLAGPQASASALIRVCIVDSQTSHRFWPQFQRSLVTADGPPTGYLQPLRTALSNAQAADVRRWTTESYLQPTDRSDTHPCLRERLHHIGMPNLTLGPPDPPPAPAPGQDAAELWLGPEASTLERTLDASWAQDMTMGWAEAHAQAMRARTALTTVASDVANGKTDAAHLWELARLTHQLEGDQAAMPALQALLEVEPTHAQGCFALGCCFLDQDDARGVGLLEQAMRSAPEATTMVQARLKHFHSRHGQAQEAQRADMKAWERSELEAKAARERATVPGKATALRAHGLSQGELAPVLALLASEREVKSATLVMVQTTYLPEVPYRLLCIHRATAWWKVRSQQADVRLLQRISRQLALPGSCLVINDRGHHAAVAKRARKTPESQIYSRS